MIRIHTEVTPIAPHDFAGRAMIVESYLHRDGEWHYMCRIKDGEPEAGGLVDLVAAQMRRLDEVPAG